MSKNKSDLSRRRFLSKAAVGITGAGLAGLSPGLVMSQETETKKETAKTAQNIIMRKFGKNGPEQPIVSMGTGACNDPGVVQAAFELGIRHFDTAASYSFGRNEQMIGQVIKKMGVRDKVFIATKITAVQDTDGMTPSDTKKEIHKKVNACLRRLKTDYVDLLYLHSLEAPEQVNNPAIFEALAELKDQKKILMAGTSTHTDMANVINETIKYDIFDAVLTSINISMKDDGDLLKAIKAASEKGLGVVAMKTQAGGNRLPNPQSRQNYTSSTIMTASLKWVLNNKNITTSITGMTNYEHMNENFSSAYDLNYNDDEKKFLKDNKAIASIGFCRQCRQCLPSCPYNAEIPTLMRTYMYAAQYASFEKARNTFDSIPTDRGIKTCIDCSTCVASCVNSVDIPNRISELKLIYS